MKIRMGRRLFEVAEHVLLGAPALLVAHDQHRLAAELGEPAHDGPVGSEAPIALDLEEVGEELVEVVERVGPVGVPGELDDLPGREVVEDLDLEPLGLPLQLLDLVAHIDRGGGRELLQLFDLGLEGEQRPFELDGVGRAWHARVYSMAASKITAQRGIQPAWNLRARSSTWTGGRSHSTPGSRRSQIT